MDPVALYHRLPYALKMAAAGVHGWRLRRWRYGPETDRLVDEASERERWSAERWAEWQHQRLHEVLTDASEHVPAYAGLDPDRPEGWPLLSKLKLRESPLEFLDGRFEQKSLYRESTSGTSGTPLRLFWSRQTVREWYALAEARFRRWYGVSRHDRWAMIGGQLVAKATRTSPPFWVWNAGLHQLYLSSYHLSPQLVHHYLEALERHRVRYLWGYPSALASLAAMMLERGLEARSRQLGLKVAIANAEPVFEQQRELVRDAFDCPMRETYGMAELVAAASECEHGRLHLWPDVGQLELLDDNDQPAVEGRLVATGLIGPAQPLVRYETGDRLRLSEEQHCSCGRTLPRLEAIEGRVDDMIVTPDGRRIGRLDPVFKTDLPIVEAQIIQQSPERVRVLYVPAPTADESLEDRLLQRLGERLPGLGIELCSMSRIPRGPQGKFRAVVGLGSEPESG